VEYVAILTNQEKSIIRLIMHINLMIKILQHRRNAKAFDVNHPSVLGQWIDILKPRKTKGNRMFTRRSKFATYLSSGKREDSH
jgi:hypothetical protein